MTKATLIIAGVACVGAAQAHIFFVPGPGNLAGTENVLFNGDGLMNGGPLVQGRTNQTSSMVDFFGAGEDLQSVASGQARVEAMDGQFTNLNIGFHDPNMAIDALILNLMADENGEVTFIAHVTGGTTESATFNLRANGQNFFRIFGTQGQTIDWLRLESTAAIGDVRQVRVGGTVVPEPSTMIGVAGLALAALMRRRR